MKKYLKKTLVILLNIALIMCIFPYGTRNNMIVKAIGYGLNNPQTDSNGITTWDYVYFGNYWQEDTNGDGTADKNDMKTPIKWKVLSVNGDDAFLLADQNLDCKNYNETDASVTWENCTLRTWLNKDFLMTAFSSVEQAAIRETTVLNDENLNSGEYTLDKVYLLSVAEASCKEYGFIDRFSAESKNREAQNTMYAKECGAYTSTLNRLEGNGIWWLRSYDNRYRADVDVYGYGYYDSSDMYEEGTAVRPVLHLDLKSSVWTKADIVSPDFVEDHVNFVNSQSYTDILEDSYAKIISTGLDTPTGKTGETMYHVLNSASEILSGKAISMFDNPYDLLLADLIQDQTETGVLNYKMEYSNEILNGIEYIETLCDMNSGEWEANPEYKTSLETMIKECTTDVDKDSEFYKLCERTFGSLIGSEEMDNYLKKIGISTAALDVLDKYNNVVEWVVDCFNYVALVKAFRSTSTEFKSSLMAAEYYMAANLNNDSLISRADYLGYYEDAVDKYISFMDDDKVNELLFETFFVDGIRKVADVFGETIAKNTFSYLVEGLGISSPYVLAVVYAYNTGWKIGEAITQNGENIECRELIRATYFLEEAMIDVVDASASELMKNKTIQAAKYFDASYNILQDIEVYALETYIKYLNNQQSNWLQCLIHGHYYNDEYNLAEMELAKLNILEWENTCCHTEGMKSTTGNTISLFKICCPTDVYVYDKEGALELSIRDGVITDKSRDITAAVVGEMKVVAISNVVQYDIQIKATDVGTMDYFITMIDSSSREILQTTSYINVALTKDQIFSSECSEIDSHLETNGKKINPTAVIEDASDMVKVNSIVIDAEKYVNVNVGETYQLDYSVFPTNATIPTLSWSSSDDGIVKVNEKGLLTAVAVGTASVQCVAIDGSQVTATIEIMVTEVPMRGPTAKPTVSPTVKPVASPTIKPTASLTVKPTAKPFIESHSLQSKVGAVIDDGKAIYKVIGSNELQYMSVIGNKAISVHVPDTVAINGVVYKVTSIKANAFNNNKKIKKVIIGKNVKSIGKNAFRGCKKLKIIIIKTKKLTAKTVGKNTFKGTGSKHYKKLTVKVPAKKYVKTYKKLLQKKGLSKKVKVKK